MPASMFSPLKRQTLWLKCSKFLVSTICLQSLVLGLKYNVLGFKFSPSHPEKNSTPGVLGFMAHPLQSVSIQDCCSESEQIESGTDDFVISPIVFHSRWHTHDSEPVHVPYSSLTSRVMLE